jgi:hypothetical protein
MSDKPVVVYGASGYTGRLVCEYLRNYQIPFVAAGRNEERLIEITSKIPGIETAEYEVAAIDGSVESLIGLMDKASVMCNTVGPFEYLGEPVVEASLKAGCHYLDTTGEPAFIKMAAEKYGDAYRADGLILSPATAYMYTPIDIAAHICIERSDIDTLEGLTSANGVPTFASTQSIFALLKTDAKFLENGELVSWPPAKGYEVDVPGHLFSQLAHNWGGGSLPLWMRGHTQIHSARQLTSFTNRVLMEGVIDLHRHYEDNIKELPEEERIARLAELAQEMQPGEPPRENMRVHRTLDQVVGTGSQGRRRVIIQSTCPYLQTGLFQAAIAHYLLLENPKKAGFTSACEVAGHEYLLGQQKQFLPVNVTVEDD